LQMLSEVSITYFRKEGAELARLESIEIVKSSFELASRAESAMLLPYIAESVLTFVPESELGGDVYRLTRHLLDALDAGAEPSLAARYFEVWLLRFAGLFPDDRACAACGAPLAGDVRLDPEIPGFLGEECAGPNTFIVSPRARALLGTIRRNPLDALRAAPPERAALDALEHVTREIRRRFLGHELKSYPFLKALA
ncbi:MAG TPA: DNA repair protein RecO, partial [Thermoanaerobaculia bacterium]|nr:DNA repair protein RecO [Thermoanaerobaculia bacterium]